MNSKLLILISALSANCSFGQTILKGIYQLNTITTAVPFLNIAPDARSTGMGEAGATTPADAYALHWNTSKTAFSKKKLDIGFTYSPWLRGLVDDMKLYSLSGYSKIGDRHAIGGSVTYFDLGSIRFFNFTNFISYTPKEFEFLIGYSFKFNDRHAIGINGKFINSNLIDGIAMFIPIKRAGQAFAVDLSYTYSNQDLKIGSKESILSFGANISNMGNKIGYTNEYERDFIPTNLRLGSALTTNLNDRHQLTAAIDLNKLLVPTPPFRDPDNWSTIISGKENNIGVIPGMIQSFYDAPGNYEVNDNGDYEIAKNSRFVEELREINIGGGLEYWYRDILAFRAGYFHESAIKGNRKFITYGVGTKWRFLELNVASRLLVTQNNPLANSISTSLLFRLE